MAIWAALADSIRDMEGVSAAESRAELRSMVVAGTNEPKSSAPPAEMIPASKRGMVTMETIPGSG